MKVLIEGAKLGYELSQTKAFQKVGSTHIDFPDCANTTKYSDEYWECMIRVFTATIYHPVGKFPQ